jgi:deoxyribose-phosphate aldolase
MDEAGVDHAQQPAPAQEADLARDIAAEALGRVEAEEHDLERADTGFVSTHFRLRAKMAQMSRSLTPVSRVGVDERAAALGKRSIKTSAKREGIRIATSMLDLTTSRAPTRPARCATCARRRSCRTRRDPRSPRAPPSASTPALVGVARRRLRGSGVAVASVSTGFPAGQTSLSVKVTETREAVEAGATEIDMVISRDAYLSGDDKRVAAEIEAVKERAGGAPSEGDPRDPRAADVRALCATRPSSRSRRRGRHQDLHRQGRHRRHAGVVLVMLETVRDHFFATGRVVGVKAAGGVSTTKQAMHMLVLVKETLGDEWLTADRFRIGASSVLNDLLMQYAKLDSGHYGRSEDFSRNERRSPPHRAPLGLRARARVARLGVAARQLRPASSAASSSRPATARGCRRSTRPPRSRSPRSPSRARRTSLARSRPRAPPRPAGRRCRRSSAASTCSASRG